MFWKYGHLEADRAGIAHEVQAQGYGEERNMFESGYSDGGSPAAQASFAAKRARLTRSNPAAIQTALCT